MSEPTRDDLLNLGRGFMESRILLSAAQLDVFTLLQATPMSAGQVAQHIAGDERAVTILLDAVAAMGLLEKSDSVYHCPRPIARHLAADSPESVLPMLHHCAGMWQRWSELTGLARGDEDAIARARQPGDEDRLRAFIGAMHVVASPKAAEIIPLVRPGDARRLLDVGGASGTYTIAFLRACPQMQATVFDRSPVMEMAARRMTEAGLEDRVTLVAGDFYVDPLPGGHDLALLFAIAHQNSREQNVALFQKVLGALEPGGRLVIRDHVISEDRLRPRAGAIFAVNMLCGTDGGNVYTLAEYEADLSAAGFERVGLLHDDQSMDSLVEAYRPG